MKVRDEFIDKFIDLATHRQEQSIVIFLSSGAISNSTALDEIARDVKLLAAIGMDVIIVHDFGNLPELAAKHFNLEMSQLLAGLGPSYLADIASMLLCQQVAGKVSRALDKVQQISIPVSGQNYNLIQAKKTRRSYSRPDLKGKIHLGLPSLIDTTLLDELDKTELIYVVSPAGNVEDSDQAIILEPYQTSSMLADSLAADILLFLVNKEQTGGGSLPLNLKCADKKILNQFSSPLKDACEQALEYNIDEIIVSEEDTPHSLLNSLLYA